MKTLEEILTDYCGCYGPAFDDKDGNLNLRVPFKLRWSYINKIRRHNFDRDLDRAELAGKREKASKADMERQINEIE